MAISVTHLDTRLDYSPGATSEVSNSVSHVTDRHYFVLVTQFRQSSSDPDIPTLSGWSQTWTQVVDDLWASTGTTRRRSTLFHAHATSTGSGVLTYSYTNQPAFGCITIIECSGTTSAGYVDAYSSGGHTATTSNLDEPIVMNSPGSTDNRVIVFVAGNTNSQATARLELTSDTNGDVDWTTSNVTGSASAPVSVHLCGYYNGDPGDDLNPGWIQTTANTNCNMIAVEVEASTVTPGSISYAGVWGILGAPPSFAGFGLDPFGTTPLGGI
jgi:hypothetical protein